MLPIAQTLSSQYLQISALGLQCRMLLSYLRIGWKPPTNALLMAVLLNSLPKTPKHRLKQYEVNGFSVFFSIHFTAVFVYRFEGVFLLRLLRPIYSYLYVIIFTFLCSFQLIFTLLLYLEFKLLQVHIYTFAMENINFYCLFPIYQILSFCEISNYTSKVYCVIYDYNLKEYNTHLNTL